MSNTTKWISTKEKIAIAKQIEKMENSRNKSILYDVFINEMSCREVALQKKYESNRGTPISIRMVQNIVKEFYPDYWKTRQGKGHTQNESRRKAKDLKYEIMYERGCKCEMCGVTGEYLELHHIIPVAFGGDCVKENLLLLCEKCHDSETQKQKWGDRRKACRKKQVSG
jgi:5-methylcytosine-specific restriction endonuclease McrA